MTEYETALARVLDEILPRGAATGDWDLVLREAEQAPHRRGPRGWALTPRRRLSLALVALVLVVLIPLTALGVTRDWWFLGSSLAPAPTGTVTLLREGNWNGLPWSLTAYRSAQKELCLDFAFNPGGGQSRPPAPPPSAGVYCSAHVRGMPGLSPSVRPGVFAFFGSVDSAPGTAGTTASFVAGPTAADVARVRITHASGVVTVDTFPAPSELGVPIRFFVALFPPSDGIRELVALDKDGNPLGHATLSTPPGSTQQQGNSSSGSDFFGGS